MPNDLPLLARCRGFRDRLVADPKFQRWASASPLTRWLVRRRSRALFDLCAGFVYSQILVASVRLRLFDILFESPRTLPELAELLALSPDAAKRLLDGAVALKLAERRGKTHFGLGEIGAALAGNAAAAALIEHQPLLYADLLDPVALLRGTAKDTILAGYWPYAAAPSPARLSGAQVAPYSALMAASQPMIAEVVLDAYPMNRHRRLLDVGGGEGVFLAAAASRAPGLGIMLFDLPAVLERARARLGAAGLSHRAAFFGGSFLTDPLPEGADIVSLIRIVHDHEDEAALAILRAVRRILPPEGTLLVIEAMSGTAGAETVGDAYYAFYTLAMGRGQPRRPEEIGRLLLAAGFGSWREVPGRMPVLTRIIAARP